MQVDIDLLDPDNVFGIKPSSTTGNIVSTTHHSTSKKLPHNASVILNVGEKAAFDVSFTPSAVQRSQGNIRLTVINNQYEDSVVQLVGEGYEDEVTLDNIHSIVAPVDPEQEEGNMADDDVPGKSTF